MFDIGPEKLLMILGVALIFFGPKKLPEMARSIGKGLREFRNASSSIREEISAQLEAPEDEASHSQPTALDVGAGQPPELGEAPREGEPGASDGERRAQDERGSS